MKEHKTSTRAETRSSSRSKSFRNTDRLVLVIRAYAPNKDFLLYLIVIRGKTVVQNLLEYKISLLPAPAASDDNSLLLGGFFAIHKFHSRSYKTATVRRANISAQLPTQLSEDLYRTRQSLTQDRPSHTFLDIPLEPLAPTRSLRSDGTGTIGSILMHEVWCPTTDVENIISR